MGLRVSEEEEIKLQEYVHSKDMIFFSSPFSRAAALRLNRMNVPAYKIGSGECNNYPLIELISSFKKPMPKRFSSLLINFNGFL